jgi:hypothetical protein
MDAVSLMIGLGGLYIISNRCGSDVEDFSNKEKPSLADYPVSKKEEYEIKYNQPTDKYFNGEMINNERKESKGQVYGLSGELINESTFTHSNMKPFFGGKIKGGTYSENSQYILDNLQGSGSQQIEKADQAPLFKPKPDMSHIYGAPNNTDFMRSRIVSSMNKSNTKPWKEEQIGPGLGLDYKIKSSTNGFNNGMEQRDYWKPRDVNELRVLSNPKQTYSLVGHEGPVNQIKDYGGIKTQGTIEKHGVDTDYEVGPSRWFTTTGAEIAPTARSKELLSQQNRTETTREYYGGSNNEGATYVTGESAPVHKSQLPAVDIPAISSAGRGPSLTTDYGNGSYNLLANNRTTTKQDNNIGGVYGSFRAIVSPILDTLRPTRKEDFIDNIRQNGNVKSGHVNSHIYDPTDITKTTIREQTEKRLNHLNVQNQGADGYKVKQVQPSNVNRSTTSRHYIGGASPGFMTESMNYDAAYKQHNNNNKTHVNRPNQGGMSILNGDYYPTASKPDNNIARPPNPSRNISSISGNETRGLTYIPDVIENIENKRNDPDLLKAFKENPYTHSLSSH